jgi:hypothetical protein
VIGAGELTKEEAYQECRKPRYWTLTKATIVPSFADEVARMLYTLRIVVLLYSRDWTGSTQPCNEAARVLDVDGEV